MEEKLKFLFAPRFWMTVLGAVAIMFGPDGVVTGPEIYQGLVALSAAFVVVGTVDRNVSKLAESKQPVIEEI